jgi:hypothetical protein
VTLIVNLILGLLVLFVVALVITALMNLWIGVPSVPTPMPIVRTMIALAKLKGQETVLDLGAGDGRLLIEAQRQYPDLITRGWEMIPTVWAIGVLRMFVLLGRRQKKPRLILGNALQADLSHTDVLFLYLFPSVMDQLMQRFERELQPGTRIISHTFLLPGKTPVAQKKVQGYWGETSVFVYVWGDVPGAMQHH